MSAAIARILCRLGLHDWEHWLCARTCIRCGKTHYLNDGVWGRIHRSQGGK